MILLGLFKKIFGDYSSKEIKRLKPQVEKTLGYEEAYKALSDAELKHKTVEFKERLANGETLGHLPRSRRTRAQYAPLPGAD